MAKNGRAHGRHPRQSDGIETNVRVAGGPRKDDSVIVFKRPAKIFIGALPVRCSR